MFKMGEQTGRRVMVFGGLNRVCVCIKRVDVILVICTIIFVASLDWNWAFMIYLQHLPVGRDCQDIF